MNKEMLREIENTISANNDYKEHYHLCTYFEVEHIDTLLKEYKKSKQALNDIREYVIKEKEFNDSQIAEYKKCIETNENGKFNDEEKKIQALDDC